jgi:hypothetical protein
MPHCKIGLAQREPDPSHGSQLHLDYRLLQDSDFGLAFRNSRVLRQRIETKPSPGSACDLIRESCGLLRAKVATFPPSIALFGSFYSLGCGRAGPSGRTTEKCGKRSSAIPFLSESITTDMRRRFTFTLFPRYRNCIPMMY